MYMYMFMYLVDDLNIYAYRDLDLYIEEISSRYPYQKFTTTKTHERLYIRKKDNTYP